MFFMQCEYPSLAMLVPVDVLQVPDGAEEVEEDEVCGAVVQADNEIQLLP